MPDYRNNPDSFDVDKELDELLKTLHTDKKNEPPKQKSTPETMPPKSGTQNRSQSRPQNRPQSRPQKVQERPKQRTSNIQLPSLPGRAQKNAAPKTKIVSTTKDGIKIYEDKTDYSKINDDNASYYSGEVYFAAKKPEEAQATNSGAAVTPGRSQYKPKNKLEAIIYNLGKTIRNGGTKGTLIYVGILLVFAILLSLFAMSFVNDILALNRGDDVVTITVEENATTNDVISKLDRAGLVKHGTMCKLFMKMTGSLHGSKKPVYLSGVYYLTPNMGLEKMLMQCQETQKADTVTVTIPEGFSIEQIAQKLEKSKVCMSDEFYKNLDQAQFDYAFVSGIDNKTSRYNYLEGYLYPDTYEFFVGQNASSVINKLFENFTAKWTPEYQKRADELGMSMDDVITLASIVQKEAGDAEQMPVIAAIFYNRMKSNGFPSLQSDATNVYVNKYIKPNVSAGEYDTFWAKYSTYACQGLPVGPICNPGNTAIKAVLWPSSTDAYYFCHDKSGNIYTAKTEAEHNANYYKTLTGGDEDETGE